MTFQDEIGDKVHTPILMRKLPRAAEQHFPEMLEEVRVAFGDTFPVDQGGRTRPFFLPRDQVAQSFAEWGSFPISDDVCRIIAQVSSRMFVGLPLCEFIN